MTPVKYTAVIGDGSPAKMRVMSAIYQLWGFNDFKVKLSGDLERDCARFKVLPKGVRVRADANNFWSNAKDCVTHIQSLGLEIWAIEEPVAAGDSQAMLEIAKTVGVKIVLDESLLHRQQLKCYSENPEYWIANIRVSKCGGLLRSIKLANEAQALGIPVILGAHVGETSILTRAALAVGHALDHQPLAREGAYGEILIKNDITKPALRFGRKAILDPKRYNLSERAGLGMEISEDTIAWVTTF